MKPWTYLNPDARLREDPPKKKRDLSWLWITLSVLLLLCFLTLMALQPHFESQAYNRLTGAHTTYWDALWLELRVQEAPRRP